MNDTILIIGAGMAGLSAARELTSQGLNVRLFEKSNGVGGRMATRRFAGGTHDTGAQYISVRTSEFQEVMDEALAAEAAKIWAYGFSMQHEPPVLSHPRYCGTLGMTSLPKYMANNLKINCDWKVSRLEQKHSNWIVHKENGETAEGCALLITAPAPQTLELLSTINQTTEKIHTSDLETVQYDPCIAVVLALDNIPNVPEPGAMFITEGKLRWIADNQKKGISQRPSITLHASAEYSRAHYNDSDDELLVALASEAKSFLGMSRILEGQVRRWRYSQPSRTCLKPFVVCHSAPPLVVAGDGMMDSKVEGAFQSGLQAARWLTTTLSG
ncbi:MAG: NAD(P)/FAD-dependent oxidoreductase [Sumerlaeia bacterium]